MSPPRRAKPKGATPVDALKHDGDSRTNIPTEELRSFAADEDGRPPEMLYPRDPSLDPQLVWRGKDEQDAGALAVPTVPIYIQEKIHPQALIENLRDTAGPGEQEPELKLFDEFNGIEFEQLVDFYEHEQNWSNRLILGDALAAMNSLAEKERLRGKVQTIYIDPPYGIEFGSNWQVSTRDRSLTDGRPTDATRQPEQIKAFRDTWEDGIHTYLSYLRDRFTVARDLLAETGSLFVQMSDTNAHLVRSVLDEVFGAQSFVSQIVFQTTSGFPSKTLATLGDFLLWYARDPDQVKVRRLFDEQPVVLGEGNASWLLLPDGSYRGVTAAEKRGDVDPPDGAIPYKPDNLQSQGAATEPQAFDFEGRTYEPGRNSHWKPAYPEGLQRLAAAQRIHVASNSLQYRRLHTDFPFQARGNIWTDTITGSFTERKTYVVQTNTKVIERCLLMTSDPGDLVLDPTCGSGTTAVVAEKHGRRWIGVDTSRVALALARQRLMSARYPAYLLADSPEGQRKESELTGRVIDGPTARDISRGFVYRRVPHITLKSIAHNPDIHEGMSREQIDAAITRHADQEVLYDQPYEQPDTIRVTGRFTVESLSPHRMVDWDDRPESEPAPADQTKFANTILENLKAAGVQNTVREERIEFTRLEPFAGEWVHARGEFEEKGGDSRTVAVSIGPGHETVDSDYVREAAKEAMRGAGSDLLLVCAFAFDANAAAAANELRPSSEGDWAVAIDERKLGRLPVLLVRMNPDLAMGDELLKKTGAGNLFTVFGEPDISIERDGDGQLVVEIRGLDVYDPTTGQVRSSSTDDIACWFIDTNYNAESFFVRHAYFTGAGDPYAQLKRALRADIDEEAWQTLYQTHSRPFDPPETGRIAVKVINHYGDEILQTYEI